MNELFKLLNNNREMIDIYEACNKKITSEEINAFIKINPELNIVKITEEFDKKYLLLNYMDFSELEAITPHLLQYINIIDDQDNKI